MGAGGLVWGGGSPHLPRHPPLAPAPASPSSLKADVLLWGTPALGDLHFEGSGAPHR